MNDPEYGDLLSAAMFLSFAVYSVFQGRVCRRKLRWPSPSNDYPTSSITRWLVFTTSLVAALWNAARGFRFFDPSSSMLLGFVAFLLAMTLAVVVSDRRDRRRSRAQPKDA